VDNPQKFELINGTEESVDIHFGRSLPDLNWRMTDALKKTSVSSWKVCLRFSCSLYVFTKRFFVKIAITLWLYRNALGKKRDGKKTAILSVTSCRRRRAI